MEDMLFSLLEKEKGRQTKNIELIASENYTSKNVLKMLGSELTNKYAEGYPGKRYYSGCQFVDEIEKITIKLAQDIFNTDYEVNVQPHSGSSANMGVYLSILRPGDTIFGMSLNSGGHLTHGAFPSFSGNKYGIFNSVSYNTDENGLLDYKQIEEQAIIVKPKIIVAGASAYARKIDFNRFREIADKVGAYLLVDMAHIAGLIVANEHMSPFGIADFITTTTHKTLRGPRGGVIFSKNKKLGNLVNSTIFPGIQGGPAMNIIAAKGIAFSEAKRDEFKSYIQDVVKNSKILEEIILEKGKIDGKQINLVGGGTDNHLLLLDFKELGLTGKEVEEELEEHGITVNKNSVPKDLKPHNPSGIRIGTPAITSRGINEDGIRKIGENLVEIIINIYKYKKEKNRIKEFNLNITKNLTIYP